MAGEGALARVSSELSALAPRDLPCFEEVYGDEEALRFAQQNKTRSGLDVHAILSWKLPKPADLCMLAIEASGLQPSQETREYLVASSPTNEYTNSNQEAVLSQAQKRRYYEAELTCEPLLARIRELNDLTALSHQQRLELQELEQEVRREAVTLEHELDVWTRMVFVKIHVPFAARCWVAEKLHLVKPLKRTIRLAQRKRNLVLDAIDPMSLLSRLRLNRATITPAAPDTPSERGLTSGDSAQHRARRRSMAAVRQHGLSEEDAAFLVLDDEDGDEEHNDTDGTETQEITSEFSIERGSAFRNFDKPDIFFTPAQNLRLTRQILLERPFTPQQASSTPSPATTAKAQRDIAPGQGAPGGDSDCDWSIDHNSGTTSTAVAPDTGAKHQVHIHVHDTEDKSAVSLPSQVGHQGNWAQPKQQQQQQQQQESIKESELVSHAFRSRGYQLLLTDGVYSAVFALHENTGSGRQDEEGEDEEEQGTAPVHPTLDDAVAEDTELLSSQNIVVDRSGGQHKNLWLKLALHWSSWRNWRRHQPLSLVKNYFGEKVGFYFLWLEFYTKWLAAPAALGLVIFFLGFAFRMDRGDVTEYCASNKTICGVCGTCEQWTLGEACSAYKAGYLFDNGGTVLFAFLMSVWSTFFLEFWKREQNRKAYSWRVRNFEETEPHRPQFRSEGIKMDDVTGLPKPFFPSHKRRNRYIVSALTIATMLTIVILAALGVILARTAIRTNLYESSSPKIRNSAGAITSIISALTSLAIILLLGRVYATIASTLTRWENHERESSFERALAIKVFLFEFVNNFASIFYIAFFKGQFVGRPGNYVELFGYRQDECPQYGCLIELTIQLSVIMVGKQALGNMKEVVIPYLLGVWKRWSLRRNFFFIGETEDSDAAAADDSSTTPPQPPSTSSRPQPAGQRTNTLSTQVGGGVDSESADGSAPPADTHAVVTASPLFSSPVAVPRTVGRNKPFNKIVPWAVQYGFTAYPGLFREYLEMILQFGFTTLFAASFPLAPLFALLNNIVEIRLDAKKHMHVFRRPFGMAGENIGVWQYVLQWLSIIAVVTNAFVIAITSNFIPRFVYATINGDLVGFVDASYSLSPVQDPTSNQYNCFYAGYRDANGSLSSFHFQITMARFAFVIIFEHLVFTCKYLLNLIIYDVPADVEIKIRREEYQAKVALDKELKRRTQKKQQ